jgi:hypothetical protein
MPEEHVGDWTIKEWPANGTTHAVVGWGIRWYCKTIEDARKAAELLDRVTRYAVDMSGE